ncbi:unnamed protein product [Mytilus edulis]|uniref:Phosphatidylinositol transfer protein N-terminal domain-containing protein n=1 Tax=Mytilus edulis TaxID=6550 RepID=A0A8S3RR09_MYTED|nr:unnamed protein product [Mytilus edulis]
MSDLFSEDGIVTAHDEVDFNCKSENLCTKYPVFADYYNKRLKNRILDHVNRPLKRQSNPDRLWTNNNCESMNHRFKIATDWKPQILPELLTKIYDITKLHFIDLKRSLYGQGNYELSPLFQKHYTSPHIWGSKTAEEKDKLFKKLLSSKTFTNKMLTSTNGKLTIPNDTSKPIMCSYKAVKVYFEMWGMQTKVEQFGQRSIRDILVLGHKQAFAWIDEWIDMSMEDLRKYETETNEKTNAKVLNQ